MDERRFERLEDKVDEIKEDVGELKAGLKMHMEKVDEHIAGDKKIINEITPLLSSLPALIDMAEDHQYKKKRDEEQIEKAERLTTLRKAKNEKLRTWSIRLGLLSTVVGIVFAYYQFRG